jgi:hypothetical protein
MRTRLSGQLLLLLLLLRVMLLQFLIESLKYIGILLEYSRSGRICLLPRLIELLLLLRVLLHPLRLDGGA